VNLTEPEARRLLAGSLVARMAAVTEAGRPHIVPVTFAVDGNYIYTAVDAKPKNETARGGLQRVRNIEAEPRVALLARYPKYRDVAVPGPVIAIRAERWSGWSASPAR